MRVLSCVKVPAPDGVSLETDVYLPDGPGSFPAVISRTPYNRHGGQAGAKQFTERGYAFVTQDCRGKFGSEGVFTPIVVDEADGQATLNWTAEQRWCNGRIGLFGGSYGGIVQIPAAIAGHEALRVMLPRVTPTSYFHEWIRHDGCFAPPLAIRWCFMNGTSRCNPPLEHVDWNALYRLPTFDAIEAAVGTPSRIVREWAAHDRYDAYWQAIDQDPMMRRIQVPALHSGGWFDQFIRGTFAGYEGIRDRGATKAARGGQRLLVTPTGHGGFQRWEDKRPAHGDWVFPQEAAFETDALMQQCLDYYLKEEDNGFAETPKVQVFLMGANRWLHADDWPPPGAAIQAWHLDSDGRANTLSGDGRLTMETPRASAADRFRYNPEDPVPTRGGHLWPNEAEKIGPVDQRELLGRQDMLVYRSEPLAQPLCVAGAVNLELAFASDAEDTDVAAKFCVEEPTGAVVVLTIGCLRLKFRHSWSDPQPLPKGEPQTLRIRMGNIAYRFEAGTRICLLVSSSDFPHLYNNRNTMDPPYSGARPVVANNAVLHGPGLRSCLQAHVLDAD